MDKNKESIHLGDGAYVTFDGHGYIITANHHNIAHATDKIYLDLDGIDKLENFVKRIKQKMIEEACK